MSSQRGPMTISGTYEGARATAGSSAWWNLAQKDSIGGAVVSTNIEAYGPTPGRPTLVRRGDDPYGRRSVAFTNNAPNSAAQSFAGNGPAAVASGETSLLLLVQAQCWKPTGPMGYLVLVGCLVASWRNSICAKRCASLITNVVLTEFCHWSS